MLYAILVKEYDELEQIHALNLQNLKTALTDDEKAQEGFVTWLYSLPLLQQMHQLAPSIIVKDKDKVVGYALVTLREAAAFHPDLQIMMHHLQNLQYKHQLLSQYNFYCMGQICIDKNHRGQGIFTQLYNKHKEIYSSRYELLVTEISTSNHRSQKAHEKVGFKTIYTYTDALDEWNVVVWDWKHAM